MTYIMERAGTQDHSLSFSKMIEVEKMRDHRARSGVSKKADVWTQKQVDHMGNNLQ